MNHLGNFLKERRISNGLTQKDMANRLGLKSSQFVSNIERGIAAIPLRHVESYSKVLNVSANELLVKVKEEKVRIMSSKYRSNDIIFTKKEDIFFKEFINTIESYRPNQRAKLKKVLRNLLDIV